MNEKLAFLIHLSIPPLVTLVTSIGLLWWQVSPPETITTDPFIDSPPPPAVNRTLSRREINLDVWLDLSFTRDATFFEEIVQEFEQAYPQIDVQISSFVRESLAQRVRHAVLTGAPPDVVQGHVYSLAAQGLVEPLDRRVAEWNPELLDEFLPVALNEAIWKETLYGIPVDIYTVILLYNRDHFDEAGLDYPTRDYDLFDILEAAERLTKPEEGRYGIGLTTDPWYFYAWLTSAGTDLLIEEAEGRYNLTLNALNNVDVVYFLLDMIEMGYSPLPSSRPRDYEEARDLFLQQQLSLYFGEPQDVNDIQAHYPNFPIGVASLPQTPAKDSAASVLGTSALFIPRGAHHQDAAFEFIKWVSSERYTSHMLPRTGHYPARKAIFASEDVTNNLLLAPFYTQLDLARPYRLDIYLDAEEDFANAIRAAFHKLEEPSVALGRAQIFGEYSMREALRLSPQPTAGD